MTSGLGPDVLRRREHQDAGPGLARLEGQLLQVHQRDPQRASRTPPSCSGQAYIAALNGTAAGGGYELALACDQIVLIDDGSSAVALPEVPLLGVLPGTGGLTRLVDKRGVRRDRADVFATTAEGIRGDKAVAWRLVDETAKASDFAAVIERRAARPSSGLRPARRRRPRRGRPGAARHRADPAPAGHRRRRHPL